MMNRLERDMQEYLIPSEPWLRIYDLPHGSLEETTRNVHRRVKSAPLSFVVSRSDDGHPISALLRFGLGKLGFVLFQ